MRRDVRAAPIATKEIPKTCMIDSATLAASKVEVNLNGSSLKYRSASTSDFVFKITGSDVWVRNGTINANRSALSGVDGSTHAYYGWGVWITGDRVKRSGVASNNTPKNEAATASAPYNFVDAGDDTIFEDCTADGSGYSAFLTLNKGAGTRGTLDRCKATYARRGFVNHGDAGTIHIIGFEMTPNSDTDVGILCEIGTPAKRTMVHGRELWHGARCP